MSRTILDSTPEGLKRFLHGMDRRLKDVERRGDWRFDDEPAPALGSDGVYEFVERIWVDSRVHATSGTAVSSLSALTDGVSYSLVVTGNVATQSSYVLDTGTPDDVLYPSTGQGASTQGNTDAETIYAHSVADEGPLTVPSHHSMLLVDIGSGFAHVEPLNGPQSTPVVGHSYTFPVTGEGSALSVYFGDSPTTDNNGQLRVDIYRRSTAGGDESRVLLGGPTLFDDLTDVDMSTSAPATGDVPVYDAVAELWKPGTVSGGSVPGAWTSYTPTLTQGGSVAHTVNRAKYVQIGKTVHVGVFLTVTGTGTASNTITVSLPVASIFSGPTIGAGRVYDDSSVQVYRGVVVCVGTTSVRIEGGSSAVANGLGTTGTPFTAALASGDIVEFSGTYEVA